MSNKELYLIGTVHIDPEGTNRLKSLFKRFSPKIITAELSIDRLNWFDYKIQENELENLVNVIMQKSDLNLTPLQKDKFIKLLKIQASYSGFEFKTARSYCAEHINCNLELIDSSVYQNGKENFWKGMLELQVKSGEMDQEIKEMFTHILNQEVKAYVEVLKQLSASYYEREAITQEFYPLLKKNPEFNQELMFLEKTEAPKELSQYAQEAFETIFSPERNKRMATNIRSLYSEMKEGNLLVPIGINHLLPLRIKLEDLNPRIITLADYDKI